MLLAWLPLPAFATGFPAKPAGMDDANRASLQETVTESVVQEAKLTGAGNVEGADEVDGNQIGYSVAVSGDTAIVGGPGDSVVMLNIQQAPGDSRARIASGISGDRRGGPNTPPSITPTAAQITLTQDSPATYAYIASVSDAETPPSGLLLETTSVPSGLSVFGISKVVSGSSALFSARLHAGCGAVVGTHLMGLRAYDGGAMFADADLTVTVAANTPPVLGTYPASGASIGGRTRVVPSVLPRDNGFTQAHSVSAPSYSGWLSVDSNSGVVTLDNAGPVGTHIVTVTATDACGAVTTSAFELVVSAASTAPTVTAAAGITRREGDSLFPPVLVDIAQVSDAEEAETALSVTINGDNTAINNGVSIEMEPLSLTGVVTADVVAHCGASNASFTLRVTDGDDQFSEATLNVAVTPNTPPVFASYAPASVMLGSGRDIFAVAPPTDNGGVANAALQGIGTYTGFALVSQLGDVFIGSASPVGTHTLTIRVTDNCGLYTDASLPLTVLGDGVFLNSFEDVVRTPAKMALPAGKDGQTQRLKLPTFDLQELAIVPGVVDAIEFSIGDTRALLQVRNLVGSRALRLLSVDEQGRATEAEWISLSGPQSLELEWGNYAPEGKSRINAVLKVVE